MAASGRNKIIRPPLDPWTVREKLALSTAVLRCGDQNWGAVSRAIRPYAEEEKPEIYFSAKNCALQYADLLEKIETPKRKRGEKERDSTGTVETPSNMIARRFTIERIEELKQIVEQQQERYLKMKQKMEEINAGVHDDKLDEMISESESRKKTKPEASNTISQDSQSATQDTQPMEEDGIPPLPELSSEVLSAELDFASSSMSLTDLLEKSPSAPTDASKLDLADALASIKDEPIDIEGDDIPLPPIVDEDIEVKVENKVIEVKQEEQGVASETAPSTESALDHIPIPDTMEIPIPETEIETEIVTTPAVVEKDKEDASEKSSVKAETKEEEVAEEEEEEEKEGSMVDVFPDTPSAIKDEQPSSPSSIISCDTDGGSSTRGGGKGSAGRPPGRRSRGGGRRTDRRRAAVRARMRKTAAAAASAAAAAAAAEEGSVKASDMDSCSDDEAEAGDESKNEEESDSASLAPPGPRPPLFEESVPNSPASVGGGMVFANDEEEKAHKLWKKSIMFVWRAASTHKYANVFHHPVTEDIAPGYHSVVFRPKDLQTIKRDVDSGAVRTTAEFQRDMLLMFVNAVMYNSANHNVAHMANEMCDDVMNHIEQYTSAQQMVKVRRSRAEPSESSGVPPPPPPAETGGKVLRGSRRSDAAAPGSDKEDEKKRRMSMDAESAGGKAKKRKM